MHEKFQHAEEERINWLLALVIPYFVATGAVGQRVPAGQDQLSQKARRCNPKAGRETKARERRFNFEA
jgi:hypothetical protein